jgi:Ca2+-dependent lipid-binding protein
LSAKLTRDTENFGKMDPFCQIVLGKQKQRTKTANDAGKNPVWKDLFTFKRTDEEKIKIEVWEEDTIGNNDLVGDAFLNLTAATSRKGKYTENLKIYFENEVAGSVQLEVEFIPDSSKEDERKEPENIIFIKPLNAKLQRDTESFGKMDPYCVITMGSNKLQTKVAEDGGKAPVWNDVLSFKRINEDKIIIEVWEKDGVSDDIIGTGSLVISQIINKKVKINETVKIEFKNKPAGTVSLEIDATKYNPDYKDGMKESVVKVKTQKITIKPTGATLTRDTETFGKMDPYCSINMGSQNQRTQVHKDGGKNPVWKESLVFNRVNKGKITEKVKLLHQNKEVGVVTLEIELGPITTVDAKDNSSAVNNNSSVAKKEIEKPAQKLVVKPLNAKLTRDTEAFGKMDPYVSVSLGSQKLKTQVNKDGGKTPVWKDVLTFQRRTEDKILIEVMESDSAGDDMIGQATYPMSNLISKKGKATETLKIYFKEKECGFITVEFELSGEATSLNSHPTNQNNANSKVEPKKEAGPKYTHTIVIKPLNAKLTRDTESFGKMDPYCLITLGQQKQQTQVAKDMGKNPVWKDTLTLKRLNEDSLTIDILEDDGPGKFETIAQATLSLTQILTKKGKQSENVKLQFNKKDAGQVFLEIEVTPEPVQQQQVDKSKKQKKPSRAVKK